MAREFAKLEEKGLQHAVDVVFGGIFDIKIIVGDQRRPGFGRSRMVSISSLMEEFVERMSSVYIQQTRSRIP